MELGGLNCSPRTHGLSPPLSSPLLPTGQGPKPRPTPSSLSLSKLLHFLVSFPVGFCISLPLPAYDTLSLLFFSLSPPLASGTPAWAALSPPPRPAAPGPVAPFNLRPGHGGTEGRRAGTQGEDGRLRGGGGQCGWWSMSAPGRQGGRGGGGHGARLGGAEWGCLRRRGGHRQGGGCYCRGEDTRGWDGVAGGGGTMHPGPGGVRREDGGWATGGGGRCWRWGVVAVGAHLGRAHPGWERPLRGLG